LTWALGASPVEPMTDRDERPQSAYIANLSLESPT
jgi:hypothetical protein